jgi:hypothetical protein
LIQSPSNHTNIYPFTSSNPFFFSFSFLVFFILFFFLTIIYSFIYHYYMGSSFKMYSPNKKYCIKSQSKRLPIRENLSSHVFFVWYQYKLYWLARCKECGPRYKLPLKLAGKCEKDYSVFIDPSRVTKMEICFIFWRGSLFFK